jgi:hypothetical protein
MSRNRKESLKRKITSVIYNKPKKDKSSENGNNGMAQMMRTEMEAWNDVANFIEPDMLGYSTAKLEPPINLFPKKTLNSQSKRKRKDIEREIGDTPSVLNFFAKKGVSNQPVKRELKKTPPMPELSK